MEKQDPETWGGDNRADALENLNPQILLTLWACRPHLVEARGAPLLGTPCLKTTRRPPWGGHLSRQGLLPLGSAPSALLGHKTCTWGQISM